MYFIPFIEDQIVEPFPLELLFLEFLLNASTKIASQKQKYLIEI